MRSVLIVKSTPAHPLSLSQSMCESGEPQQALALFRIIHVLLQARYMITESTGLLQKLWPLYRRYGGIKTSATKVRETLLIDLLLLSFCTALSARRIALCATATVSSCHGGTTLAELSSVLQPAA